MYGRGPAALTRKPTTKPDTNASPPRGLHIDQWSRALSSCRSSYVRRCTLRHGAALLQRFMLIA